MSELFDAPPTVEPELAPVILLHPDHIAIRTEVRATEDGTPVEMHWVERHRGTRSTHAVIYDLEEIHQLQDALDRKFGRRPEVSR